jgi:hypothetical protein
VKAHAYLKQRDVNYLYLVKLIADTFLPEQASNITSYGKTNNIFLDKEWNNHK